MNVIHRQVLDFTIDESLDYFGLSEKIRVLYWDKILPRIEEVFSKLAPVDTVYRFDQLEIDLGVITPDMLESNITGQIEKDLRKTLQEALFHGGGGGSNGHSTVLSTRRLTEKNELLNHFLQTGFFPWWSASNTGTLDALFQEAIFSETSGFVDFLRHRATPAHIGRLVRQFSPESVETLLKTTGQHLAWRQLRTDFRKITGTMSRGSEYVRDLNEVFNQLVLSVFLQNRAVGKTEAKALVAAISRLESVDVAEKTAGIKAVFEVNRPVSEAMRDFLAETRVEAGQNSAKTGERVTEDSIKGKPSRQGDLKPDSPFERASDRAVVEKAMEEGVFIKNAGLVLLSPFFRSLFEKAKLLEGGHFLSEPQQERAVLLSQYLVNGQREFEEPDLLLNKILCGWPVEKTLARRFTPNVREKRAVKELMDSVIAHWSALGNVSATGFCNTFLIRQGKLVLQDHQFKLLVERKAFDVLLEKLPWNISILRAPWMRYPVWVEW